MEPSSISESTPLINAVQYPRSRAMGGEEHKRHKGTVQHLCVIWILSHRNKRNYVVNSILDNRQLIVDINRAYFVEYILNI